MSLISTQKIFIHFINLAKFNDNFLFIKSLDFAKLIKWIKIFWVEIRDTRLLLKWLNNAFNANYYFYIFLISRMLVSFRNILLILYWFALDQKHNIWFYKLYFSNYALSFYFIYSSILILEFIKFITLY